MKRRRNLYKFRFGKAACLVCNREIGLQKHGQLRKHVAELGGNGERCDGSWQWPHRQRETAGEVAA